MISGPVLYAPRLETLETLSALKNLCEAHGNILAGEYGDLSPLAFYHELKNLGCETLLVEILLKNKNRGLVESYLVTASSLGFSGAVLAMGSFDKSPGMPMPVYDLDTAQALRLALDMRKAGRLREDFRIGVRAASGSGAAETRARYYITEGADFIVLPPGGPVPGLEGHTITLKEAGPAA